MVSFLPGKSDESVTRRDLAALLLSIQNRNNRHCVPPTPPDLSSAPNEIAALSDFLM